MDRKLRDLERAAREGDSSARTKLVIEQLRLGQLTIEKLRVQANAGDRTALAAHRAACWGARTYSAYFSPREEFEPGAPFDRISGLYRWRSQNVSALLPGDRVIAIRVEAKKLYLLGSLLVEAIPKIEVRLKERQRPITGVSEHAFALRVAPPALLRAWRFQTTRGDRPIRHLAGGEVQRADGLTDVYLLAPDTAKRILSALE